ncbi:MXAN_6640 family putative metalloprotease [Nocardioides xinjiangensis]|uniref:MXAN_6640 family putative metalloprotease n=1 Tax=Nocardioides xinjiangensis TaxID=2817376 RepID=UPI001B30A07E|nr:MXAN_6640 family putative metalloprotease [Nocardioides sp. SYSU D00778]
MRRIVTTAVAIALVGGTALAAPSVAADNDRPALRESRGLDPEALLERSAEPVLPALPSLEEQVDPTASETLATARRVLAGDARPTDPSATLVLRDLWMKKSELRGTERRRADALLARPTDGVSDPQGFGYTVAEAPPVCNTRLCVHYVPTGTDAPPSPDWPAQNLATMDSVWSTIVDQMGYRAPVRDGARGGSSLFDVYLKDLGGDLYGFCAGERRAKKRTASGYCVLDNDFAASQFPNGTPLDNLVVTAGHEFFHAVQYAYDYAEDPWMLESTATWMEERIASHVNDNRQYLPVSQIYAPQIPLDAFSQTNGFQYGNWVFWEYLSSRYGTRIVNKAWKQAGTLKGDGNKYSLQAIDRVLRGKGGLRKNYATYAAGNLTPAANFPEGAEYAGGRIFAGKALSKRKRSKRFATRIHHLASASYLYVPGTGLDGRRWKLALRVSGPAKRTSPSAVVVVHRVDGRRQVKLVRLGRGGDGGTRVSFDNRSVGAVSVTLVNGSTRYRCDRDTVLACGGKPVDDRLRFAVKGRVTKG